jgi:hypothetical protein
LEYTLDFTGSGYFRGLTLKKREMVKKISIIILALGILTVGYFSAKKLNFWEKGIMIFKYNSSAQQFEGRGGRGGFEGRPQLGSNMQRGGRMNVPDSVRARFEARGQRPDRRQRPVSDSLSAGRMRQDPAFAGRGSFEGRTRDMEGPEGRGGRDGRGGSTIALRNVMYFLGVFAFFTVIAIYLEKFYCLITGKNKKQAIPDKDDLDDC